MPVSIRRQCLEMDEIGKRLCDAIGSRGWQSAFKGAFIDAARIAERARIQMGVGREEIDAEPASSYLSQVLDQLHRHAEIQASRGYGRYRWIWYLRRLPPEVWMGDLLTTGPYDRSIAEILATRGAGPAHCLGEPQEDGTFPIDGTVIRRIAWVCGYTKAYRHFQVAYRVIGKGGALTFDQQTPGLDFSVCRTRVDGDLGDEIREYDRRSERQSTFSHVGLPIENFDPKSHRDEATLLTIGSMAVSPGIVTPDDLDIPAPVALRFVPTILLLRELEDLLTHPSVIDVVAWNPELPMLVSLLSLATFFYGEFPLSRCQLLMSGYMIVNRDYLDELFHTANRKLREMKPLLKAFTGVSPSDCFSDAILSMEGNPSPRLPGPVAFMVKDRLLGIDLYNATNRLLALLEFPSVHGEGDFQRTSFRANSPGAY